MTSKLSLFGMVVLLTVAGLVHLVRPIVFLAAIPPWIPYPLLIIYSTGLLELTLAVALLHPEYRAFSAKLTAIYLIILIPIHFYVSTNAIAIFGIRSPALLWLRTLLQIPLIYWAWSLRKLRSHSSKRS